MKIGIDGSALHGKFGGVEYALWNLLRALAELDRDNSYTVYVPHDGPGREMHSSFPPLWRWRRLPFRGANKPRRIAWQQVQLPNELVRDRCDILHSPTYVSPIRCPVPVVLTVYDIIALSHPEFATGANRLHYGMVLPRSARGAKSIIVPSERVKQQLGDLVSGTLNKTRVVPLGVDAEFLSPISTEERLRSRERYRLPERYVLYVGNLEPKKNMRHLLRGMELIPNAPPLVIAGGARPWGRHKVPTGNVIPLGYVPRGELPALYSECAAFAFPTLAEGFGLPVLEALACGAPVVTSAAMPLPHIADSALICDPTDPASIAAQLQRILEDDALTADLRGRGPAFARDYTWERAARMTLDIYDSLAG